MQFKSSWMRARRTEITADRVLLELGKLAFSNILDYIQVNEEGTARVDLSAVTRDQAAAIKEVTVDSHKLTGDETNKITVEKVKIKLADKGVNLERLGKHLKLFSDKHELTGPDGKPINQIWTIEFKDAQTL